VEKQELFPGDLVVMATDGLWDNLFEDFVAELARPAGTSYWRQYESQNFMVR